MSKNKVILRADGNSEIGLGHIMRTLALADMLKNDYECVFATTLVNDFIKEQISKSCSSYFTLPQNESHFEKFIDFLNGDEIVVLDNYFFTSEYQLKIKSKGCKLVCIDDLINKHYYADIVINHAPGIIKEKFSAGSNVMVLTGLDYAILRQEFLNVDLHQKKFSKSIIVCFGGSDIHNITLKILEIISGIGGIENINVIISSSYLHFEKLEIYRKKNTNIYIHKNISASKIVELGKKSKLAITSASTVSYEMLSMGLDLIVGYYVDNQRNIYNGLVKYKSVKGIGNLLDLPKNLNEIVLNKMLTSQDRESAVIDGKSGKRILDAVKRLL